MHKTLNSIPSTTVGKMLSKKRGSKTVKYKVRTINKSIQNKI
jgi:hypothetical protein